MHKLMMKNPHAEGLAFGHFFERGSAQLWSAYHV